MIPDTSVSRTMLFLGTTFACQDESLGMLLSYVALVSASFRLPEVMIAIFGPGGEWGTFPPFDLMGAVWGTGRAVAHPSILQTVAEFRRQCRLYRGTQWISVDERKPTMGIEEDAFKIFVSYGGNFASVATTHPRPTSQSGPCAGRLGP